MIKPGMFAGCGHKRGQRGFKLKIDPWKARIAQTVRQAEEDL